MTNNNQEPSYEKACPFCNVDIPVPQFKSNIDTVFKWHLDGHKENSQPSSVPVEKCICNKTPHHQKCPAWIDEGVCRASPSHHEASPKVEEWTDNYIITRLIELNPNKTWKEIEPVYKFLSALLLQKEEESTLTERKRITDILDGINIPDHICRFNDAPQVCDCYFEALEQAKHLINNTQEK